MSRPNILFALADDAGMHFGAYGCPWVQTPAFDRVAREGVRFQRAFTPNAKCAPSRSCILTGRMPWQLGTAGNHGGDFPADQVSVWEVLQRHGYVTGHTCKGWAPGNPGTVDGKRRELTGPAYNGRMLAEPVSSMISPDDYVGNFRDFLDDRADERPFCFWFGCREPHRAYEYGEGINRGGKRLEDIDHVYGVWPDTEEVRTDLLDYGFEIEHFDHQLAGMLALLEERGELDNTIVVVSSDNGMPFPRIKGQDYYYSHHLPLAIRWPAGIAHPGRVVEDMVSFIDFAPTFLELAGIDQADSGMPAITGTSLAPLLRAEDEGWIDAARDHIIFGKERHDLGRPGNVGYPVRAICTERLLYIRNYEPERWPAGNPETGYSNCDCSPTKTTILDLRHDPERHHYWEWSFGKRPAEELYDIVADPDCLANLIDDAGLQDARVDLRQRLHDELVAQDDPRVCGGPPIDEMPSGAGSWPDYYARWAGPDAEELPAWVLVSDKQEP